ncbi:MAG: DUF2029 domain-containing protein [Methylobacillus sp.]|nr:DUF2029 domain-containing protein [Methylobacillus sp.]
MIPQSRHELAAGRARRIFYVVLFLCVIILGTMAVWRAAVGMMRTDYTVYIAAGQAALDHRDIYETRNAGGWRYVYPPPFAIPLAQLARLPIVLGAFLWTLFSMAAIALSFAMSANLLDIAPLKRKPHIIYGLPLLWLASLLASGLLRSQASAFMIFFMLAACWLSLKNRPVAAGFSLACATLLKVFPVTLIVWFIARRQWRAVLATAIALLVLGFVLPGLYWGWHFNLEQIARWIDVVGHPAVMDNMARAQTSDLYKQLLDTAKPRNQSLESLFLSLNMSAELARYAVAVCAAAMLAVMWAAARRIPVHSSRESEPDMAENLLCGAFLCWSLLISPIAESHYFGVLLWPLVMLVGCAERGTPNRRLQFFVVGTVAMIAVMLLVALDATAIWRPLCIATFTLWWLCVRPAFGKTQCDTGDTISPFSPWKLT